MPQDKPNRCVCLACGTNSLVLEAAGVMLPTVALYRGQRLPLTAYSVLGTPLVVRLTPDTDPDGLRLEYRTFSAPVAGTFFLRDTTEMNQVIRDFSALNHQGPLPTPAFASTINKSALSRGIAFGNAQNECQFQPQPATLWTRDRPGANPGLHHRQLHPHPTPRQHPTPAGL